MPAAYGFDDPLALSIEMQQGRLSEQRLCQARDRHAPAYPCERLGAARERTS